MEKGGRNSCHLRSSPTTIATKLASRWHLSKHGAVAYKLELPPSMSPIHDVFHISQLKKCLRVPTEATNVEEVDLQPDLSYIGYPIRILGEAERKLRNRTIKMVKVQWSNH